MSVVTSALVLGLIEAAPLVLAAMGFTLIYYLNGFTNVAFAENITFGAFFAVIFTSILGLDFYLSIIPASLLSGVASVLTYLLIFRPALRRGVGPTEMIILSVGLSFALRYGARLVFGGKLYYFDNVSPEYYSVFGVGITSFQITALLLVAVLAGLLYVFIYRTRYGEMMRALANNEELALASGINPTLVSVLIWFIAGVAGGLAGVFFGVFSFVNTLVGWNLILIVIMISIIGGVGSIRGALFASVAVGIVTSSISLVATPLYGEVLLLVLFIAFLKVRHMRSRA